MIARHTLTYVGSRAVAAALNLASLAVFTRLAPVETYGTYLLVLSWALVLYGATCQWPKFAFFALYEEGRAAAQIGTVVRLLLGTLGLAVVAASLAALAGLAAPRLCAALTGVVVGMVVFEGTLEIARTRLAAGPVAVATIARGALVLTLGGGALLRTGDPVDLALAVALANALAAIPAGVSVWPLMLAGHGSLSEARRMLAYGWPLVLSFGITALAQTVDRLIIGRTVGPEDLGAYGAIGDFLRQSFVVFGEGIALSMISIAKRDARDGGMTAAEPTLRDAARALALVGSFGAVFFATFDETLVAILLGPAYRASALAVAPFLIAASLCMLFRSYYFGQVIYFTGSSGLDAVASTVLLIVTGGLSLVLIPQHGVKGAAVALALGQALACLVFIRGAGGRGGMPVPVADIARIAGLALAAYLVARLADWGLGLLQPSAPRVLLLGLKLALIGAFAGGAAWRFNVVGLADGFADRERRTG